MKQVFLNDTQLVANLLEATTFSQRLKGLLFTQYMSEENGLMLYRCKQVHTFGMHFTIDTVFLSKDMEIVFIQEGLSPNRIGKYVGRGVHVLELAEGSAQKYNLQIGAKLKVLEA